MRILLIVVFVIMNFFWFDFVISLLNSDLGLGHLTGKQCSLALQNMPLTLTCSD